MAGMQLLEEITQWPVDNVAGALVQLDRETGAAILTETVGDMKKVVPLASVSKLLSAYAFLIAVEEGVFDLDTPAPAPAPAGSTVRHLLAHASGVGFHEGDRMRGVEERRIYSSYGFELLAELLEQESGISFPEYFHEALCEPLGMATTVLEGSPGHGIESSVSDVAKFAQELLVPFLLSQQMSRELATVQYPELIGIVPGYGMQKPCPWGLGFEIKGQKDPHWTGASMPPETIGHFGVSGTYMWFVPEARTALVVLTDRDFGEWAKPLWSEFNDGVWRRLQQRS